VKKPGFLFFMILFFVAGLYYGSQDNTYVHKFFLKPKNRFPANTAVRAVQSIWTDGYLKDLESKTMLAKVYRSEINPEWDICEVYKEAKSFQISLGSEVSVSDGPVKIQVTIDCDSSGESPLFLKSFCGESRTYFMQEKVVGKSLFKFENILDGFPKSWYVENADVFLRDGLQVLGVRPSPTDMKAFGKFSIDCLDAF